MGSATSHRLTYIKEATAQGSYWRSTATPAALRAYLRDCALTGVKEASIGGEQEQGFEQAFASLAYSYIKDKSPRLLDYIVGFQLVDRNNDNTKAMGVFGFKVGDMWLYAPVFFLNGDLKGHELLYIKNQDMFVPMKENWVNYLIARKPHVLGEGTEQDTFQLGGLLPNLSRMTRPPSGTKYGYDMPIDEWARPALPMLAALMTKEARVLYREAKPGAKLAFDKIAADPYRAALAGQAQRFDLGTFLSDLPLLKLAFERGYQSYPLIREGFDRFYGSDFFLKRALAIKADQESLLAKTGSSFLVPPARSGKMFKKMGPGNNKKTPWSLMPEKEEKEIEDPIKSGALIIEALDVDNDGLITVNKPELTESEREKLLHDTVLIKDKRDPHAVSMVYNTQVRLEMFNPSDSGIYDVLEKPGSFDKMLVLHNPHSGRGRENFCLVIRKSAPRNWQNIYRTNLWIRADIPVQPGHGLTEELKEYVEGLKGTDSLEKGGTYVALWSNGSGTCPFTIRESYGDGAYKVNWHDHCHGDMTSPRHLSKLDRPQDWEVGYTSWEARVRINQRDGTHLRSFNGELSIPKEYKIVKISDPPKPKKTDDLIGMCCSTSMDDSGSDDKPIQVGNIIDIQTVLYKEAKVLRVHDTGAGEVWLRSPIGFERMAKKAALLSLVRDHGLREDKARLILKEAAAAGVHNKAVNYFIKYADPYQSLQPGPNAPSFPHPWLGTEPVGYNQVPSIYPQEEHQPVPELDSNRTNPQIYDPFYMPDQNAMQVAQNAAGSGQKEVFDTGMLSGLLKATRQDSLVDKYMGDLMKALNALGRILMLFFYHQEEFADRYSKSELPELEDGLRNAFESIGDITLYLREKTIKGRSGIDFSGIGGAGAGGGEGAPDPSIDEVARS